MSRRIMPTIIEIRLSISLATAPIEPLKQLYISHIGELVKPKSLTALAEPSLKLTVAIIIASTGKSSIIKFLKDGCVPKTVNVSK